MKIALVVIWKITRVKSHYSCADNCLLFQSCHFYENPLYLCYVCVGFWWGKIYAYILGRGAIRILKFDSALPPFYLLLVTPNNLLHSMMIDIGLIFGLIALSENASLIFFSNIILLICDRQFTSTTYFSCELRMKYVRLWESSSRRRTAIIIKK